MVYLNSGLAQSRPLGEFFSGEGVGVVRPLEDRLQGFELSVAERRTIATCPFALTVKIVERRIWTKMKSRIQVYRWTDEQTDRWTDEQMNR